LTDNEDIRMRLAGALGLLVVGSLTAACASGGAIPEPFPTPREKARIPAAAATAVGTTGTPLPADGYAIVGTALDLRGSPYRDGGSDPSGFDCSGFVEYVFGRHGIAVPRTVTDLYRTGRDVLPNDLQAGDLVFFTTTAPGPTHVGMSIGGDEFVHAPSSAGLVRVEHLSARYWAARFIGARRLL
jgi:cell wall-associated NlpC family hydrolase